MPAPDKSLATLRPDLGGSLTEFDLAMDRQGFIATRVLPVMEVAVQAATFGKITIESLLQNAETKRAPGGTYNRGSFKFTDDSYATKENGWEEPIDDRQAKMYANYFDAEQVATQRAFDAVLRSQELRTASMIFNTTTWTGAALTTAIGTAWTSANYSTATPITNVEAAVRKVWNNTGIWPNAIILGRLKYRDVRNCTQVLDRIAASGAGSGIKATDVTPQMLAQVFDLPYVIVPGGVQNTAKEGQTAALSSLWNNDLVMVCRIAETSDIQEPCLGRTFHWSEDGSQIGGTVETYRDERVRGDVVRVRHDTHEKVLYTEMGHLLTNANGGTAA